VAPLEMLWVSTANEALVNPLCENRRQCAEENAYDHHVMLQEQGFA